VGQGSDIDRVLSEHFTAETGIIVQVIPRPADVTESFNQYQQLFQASSSESDVLSLDVIWPSVFAPHLLDLAPMFEEEVNQHFDSIIANNTIDAQLVAVPLFADFGILYYRTDLLQQYGFDHPPTTWDDLEEMAQIIQDGEQADGNKEFSGFVWQGAPYEGLTCNALEWIYSHGGGLIIEDGEVTVNNAAAKRALQRASRWVGTISPEEVVSYKEEDARQVFQEGHAAFMRNWPYAYAAGNEDGSPIKGRFGVAPLPHAQGEHSAGTVGGWQLGVSSYSQHPDAAVEFVRYMTSPEVQRWRALVGSYVPTIRSVSEDPQVVQKMPFLRQVDDIVRVTRPSCQAGVHYTEVSNIFFYGVYEMLLGGEADDMIRQMEERIEDVVQADS
jgi:trehalose/maltose transport system substrate-binding protein